MKAIEDEAKLRQPKHTPHMLLLQTKRGSDKHSDFLERISENFSVIEFEKMWLNSKGVEVPTDKQGKTPMNVAPCVAEVFKRIKKGYG